MTVIVALKENGVVYMGGDSAGTSEHRISVRKDAKVKKIGNILIGFSGSFRAGQIISRDFKCPTRGKKQSLQAFMSTTFINSFLDSLADNDYIPPHDNTGVDILIAIEGKIFSILSDCQIEEVYSHYNAIGSGADSALGALYATNKLGIPPITRVKLCLSASAQFCNQVRRPFHIIHS